MRVLVVKTSSMGDVLHTLPALSDASKHFPDIQFDWVVEKSFSEIPSWHTHVHRIIPMQWRAWRKALHKKSTWQAILLFLKQLRQEKYDLIIDAQGLLKSAITARLARGPISGLDAQSARESMASYFYQKRFFVAKKQHAITRVRELFAKVLGYTLPVSIADYQIDPKKLPPPLVEEKPYLLFLHGTTWPTKHYPETYWFQLAEKLIPTAMPILLAFGNAEEEARAHRIAQHNPHAKVLPKCTLIQMASLLHHARAIVSVDTGLSHLSAALETPTIVLYGPTNPEQIGTLGKNQIHLSAKFPCAPCVQRDCTYQEKSEVSPACYTQLAPEFVFQRLLSILEKS